MPTLIPARSDACSVGKKFRRPSKKSKWPADGEWQCDNRLALKLSFWVNALNYVNLIKKPVGKCMLTPLAAMKAKREKAKGRVGAK